MGRPRTPMEPDILKLYHQGYNHRDIAEVTGVDIRTVPRVLERNGLRGALEDWLGLCKAVSKLHWHVTRYLNHQPQSEDREKLMAMMSEIDAKWLQKAKPIKARRKSVRQLKRTKGAAERAGAKGRESRTAAPVVASTSEEPLPPETEAPVDGAGMLW